METKKSIGHSVSTPRGTAKDSVVETPPGEHSIPREKQSRSEATCPQQEPPHGEKDEGRDEGKDESKVEGKPPNGARSPPGEMSPRAEISSPGHRSLPSIGSPISVETATKQTIHVIRRKPIGVGTPASQTWPQPQPARERGRTNADDDEHNFKYCVVGPPVAGGAGPEEKIVVEAPEEKVLVGNVLLPHQRDADKVLIVDHLPHREDADKIPVADGGDGFPIARPASSGEDAASRRRRQEDMFGSAARELGLGVAHITGSMLKATAAGPTLMSRSLSRSQSSIANSGSKKRKDGAGDQERDKESIRSEPEEPRITGWKSGITAAGTGMYRGFFDGATGIFTEPYQGAREEGARGFLKGCGKGLSGALLKPSAGLVGAPGHALMGAYREVQKSVDKLEASESASTGKRRPSSRSAEDAGTEGPERRPSTSATR